MSRDAKVPEFATNHLLATIEEGPFQAIASQLETMDLPLGKVLYETADQVEFVYFPHNAVLSLLAVLSNGSTAEMATIGREGIMGLVESLGDNTTQARCIVQAAGTVSRIRAEHLRQHIERNTHIRDIVFRYIHFLFTQTLQSGVCCAIHSVEARCCRLILTMRDRIGCDELPMTHEFLAEMLGVQRPAVSIVARHLQDAGLVKQGRKMITIVDGKHLEERSCECYNTIRRSLERLQLHSVRPT